MTHNLIFGAILLFFLGQTSFGQTPLSVINNPDLSYTCKQLLKNLDQKHQELLRNRALIVRNKRLQKNLPKKKQISKNRLQFNLSRLKNELELGELKYTRMKENIIRKGCPGVIL